MAEQAAQSPFRSKIIKVYLGPDRQLYTVHSDIIYREAPCFEGRASITFFDSPVGEVELQHHKPAAFEKVLEWVYFGTVTLPQGLPEEEETNAVLTIIHTYVLADELGMESLCNKLIDTIKDWHRGYPTKPIFLSPLRNVNLTHSGLRSFLVKQLARDIMAHAVANDAQKEFFEQGGEEVWMVAKEMRGLQPDVGGGGGGGGGGRNTNPATGLDCDYHRHKNTKPCGSVAKRDQAFDKKRKRAHGNGDSSEASIGAHLPAESTSVRNTQLSRSDGAKGTTSISLRSRKRLRP